MACRIEWAELDRADAAREREPFGCPTATFDGGLDDPRTLVYLYQQRLRATLLTRAADEAAHPYSVRRAATAGRAAVERCRDGVRWLALAGSRRTARRRLATTLHPILVARHAPVPVRAAVELPAASLA